MSVQLYRRSNVGFVLRGYVEVDLSARLCWRGFVGTGLSVRVCPAKLGRGADLINKKIMNYEVTLVCIIGIWKFKTFFYVIIFKNFNSSN